MSSIVFPLHRLSGNALLQVIRKFDYINLIAFSLISTKTKRFVKSLNLAIETLAVKIGGNEHPHRELLRLDLIFENGGAIEFEIYQNIDQDRTPEIPLIGLDKVPKFVHYYMDLSGHSPLDTSTWENLGLSFAEWFEHFRSLFKFEGFRFDVCTRNEEVVDPVAIRNLLPEWTEVIIERASSKHAEKIFELFSPYTKYFDIGVPKIPQKVGIQNFDIISSYDPLKLDDLLRLNASDIRVRKFSISDARRLLKSWVKGSNPRMKYLFMVFTEEWSEENLFKGITHQIMPWDSERMTENGIIRGGYDIRTKKGILATIKICNRTPPSITMHVWN